MKQAIDLPPPPSGIHTDLTAPVSGAPQIWIRPPIQSTRQPCPFTHTGHGAFYGHFVGNPRIRQARLGKGRDRGTRLLWLPDVYRELERMAAEQAAEGSANR